MRGELEHVALESPGGSFLYLELCFLPGPASCAGGFGWERVIFELPLVPSWEPAALPFLFSLTLFYFFLFFVGESRETQTGYSELICVIRLKKKADTGYGQGFYQQGIYFFFCIGA